MSRFGRILLVLSLACLLITSAFAQDKPAEKLQQQAQQEAESEAKQLMKEMQDMGLTDEAGELDMEALQGMMEQMGEGGMFEMQEIPVGPYVNSTYGYSFTIPEGWTATYVFGVLTVMKGDMSDIMANPTKAQPTVMIMALSPEDSDNIIDIEMNNLDEIRASMMESEEENVEVEIVELKYSEVAGHKAVYTELNQTITMEMEGLGTMTNNVSTAMYMFDANDLRYNLIFASDTAEWDAYKETFKAQFKTFKLVN